MDVKFPLDNYLQMVNAPEGMQRDSYEKEFIKNVKDRIKEIQNRDYINPSENTLDFVLLFIPNEQVFGLIQEKMPDVMDFALKQKVVLCSPFTLYAMLSVVRQAHEHFRFEKDIKKIIELIEGFTRDYELFKNRFTDLGSLIDKLSGQYAEITDKSFKKLDGKIQRIEDHKKGHKIPLSLDVEGSVPKDLIDAP
jgi:DNA recombination protein RmuC